MLETKEIIYGCFVSLNPFQVSKSKFAWLKWDYFCELVFLSFSCPIFIFEKWNNNNSIMQRKHDWAMCPSHNLDTLKNIIWARTSPLMSWLWKQGYEMKPHIMLVCAHWKCSFQLSFPCFHCFWLCAFNPILSCSFSFLFIAFYTKICLKLSKSEVSLLLFVVWCCFPSQLTNQTYFKP